MVPKNNGCHIVDNTVISQWSLKQYVCVYGPCYQGCLRNVRAACYTIAHVSTLSPPFFQTSTAAFPIALCLPCHYKHSPCSQWSQKTMDAILLATQSSATSLWNNTYVCMCDPCHQGYLRNVRAACYIIAHVSTLSPPWFSNKYCHISNRSLFAQSI